MKTIFIFLLTIVPLTLTAEDVRVHTHTYPETGEWKETDWDLSGTHHFRFKRIFSVLTGAYYQERGGEGERLVFTYTRKIKADDLVSSSTRHLNEVNSAEVLEQFALLTRDIQAAYTDLEPNDSYAITVLPGEGIWLERDGEVVFFSEDSDFGDWYLDIWLGDPPIDKRLKQALTRK